MFVVFFILKLVMLTGTFKTIVNRLFRNILTILLWKIWKVIKNLLPRKVFFK